MDEFVPQSTGGFVTEGHEESDLSVRAIVTFGVILAVCGFLSFALMGGFLKTLPWIQSRVYGKPVQLTPVQQQLQKQRQVPSRIEAETESRPEWYAPQNGVIPRGEMEAHLDKTFPTPRLQYDDVKEMSIFRGSEQEWLASTGKDASGNVHISIDRAMDLIAQQGLPPVSGPYVPETLPPAVPLVPAQTAPRK